MWTYPEIKGVIYILVTACGILFLGLAYWAGHSAVRSSPVDLLMSTILAAAGSLCLLFGIATYILRRDPDIWR